MAEPPTLLAGRYRIISTLGSGGMGTVYHCRDEVLDTDWAVKEVAPPPGDEREAHALRFLEEARLLARMRHPGLPRVVDFLEQEGHCYLVMDRIHGRTLEEETGPGDPPTVLAWIRQVLQVVRYLHEQVPPVIVRDISPANLMLDQDEQVRLIDLGLARPLVPQQGTAPMLKGWGSPGYAAPEQYGQGTTDRRTDLYAVGATAWRLLTGETPPEAVSRLLGQAPLPPASLLNPDVPPELDAWLGRATALRPEDRFQDACAMDEALPSLAAGPRPSSPSPVGGGASPVWQGFQERLETMLRPYGWGRLSSVPEPFEAGLARAPSLRRIECWLRRIPHLTEEEMEAACAHARAVGLGSLGLLPSTIFVVLGTDRLSNPVAVQAVAAANLVVGYRSLVVLPLDLLEGRSLDAHVGDRFCNTNDRSDFVLNLRIALGPGLARPSRRDAHDGGRPRT